MPTFMLGSSIGHVFFPTAAKTYNETGTLAQIVRNIFIRLVQIGVFPLVALGLLSMMLFGFVFGQQWIEAGVYAQILSIYIICQFVISSLVTKQFAQGLSSLPDAKLLAVGSQKLETAEIFARQFKVPRKYKSYDLNSGEIEV